MTHEKLGARRALAVAALVALAAGAPAAQGGPPTTAELEALYWARQDSALARHTDADADFMVGMIGHHAQALVMSAMAPTHGASPAVQRLAARIINAQRDEIATMQRGLEDRGRPVPRVHIEGTTLTVHMDASGADHGAHGGMDHGAHRQHGAEHGEHGAGGHGGMDHGGMDHSDMPGMLSPAQLAELDAARGAEFDRLFLAYMIQHHGGALVMVDDLFGADGAAQDGATFKLASDIHADQRTEIARMQLMLDALTDATD